MIFGNPKVTFTTYPNLYGIIPEPVPARSVLPDWFKKLKNFGLRKQKTQLIGPLEV